MYQINSKIAYSAMIIATVSTLFSPFLKVFMVGSWNLYEVDARLFYITNGLLLCVFISALFKKGFIFKFLSRVFLCWVLIAVAAVYFKVNNFFGMKLGDGLIAKAISFKWGWLVLLATAIVMVFSVYKIKINVNENESN